MTRLPAPFTLGPRPLRGLLGLVLGVSFAASLPAQTPAPRSGSNPDATSAAGPARRFDPALFAGLRYRMVGPSRGGRVTAVTGVASQPFTFYFGSTGGGVWKTTDAGQNWTNVSDGFFGEGSMGALDVADSDPNIVYAGTGSEGIRSNVSIGRGIYRSNDAGKSWAHLGLREMGQLGAVVVHPANPEVVYVAALGNPFAPNPERGVYRTRDGGRNWQRILFVSDSTGAVDLEMQPGNPEVIYASMWRAERKPWTITSGGREGGIYRSTDGGENWTKLADGLPTGLIGKSDLAISPANPSRVYALIEAAPGGGLYRSDDAGASWRLVNRQPSLIFRPFYYINVDADPKNADIVYVSNESFFRSEDGGRTFRTIPTPHGDNHDLWINPNQPEIWVQANDGGANVTLNGGRSWSTQYNQPTAEFYQVAVDNQFPYRIYGAQQDNSTVIVPSVPLVATAPDLPAQLWRQGSGCETGPIVPHPLYPDTVYGACKGQFSRINLKTGQEQHFWVGGQFMYGHNPRDLKYRFQRTSPIEISPHDPRVIYHASQFVHRTRDEGRTWERISPDLTANLPAHQVVSGGPITRDITGEEFYSTLYAVRESPLEEGLLWAGANDGPIHVSRNGGKSWTNVTPRDLPPGGRVQNIEPSPHRAGTAYVAVLRYLLGDFQPYLYRTDDFGRTWTRLTDGTNGIPADHPTRVVREDPARPGLLYAGTEFGMFVSWDNGRRWQPLQLNLPATPVTDIRVQRGRGDLVLSTQGRSFWVLDDLSPLRQMGEEVTGRRAHLFRPRPAYRIRYEEVGSGPDAPQFPPPGANIDYHLAGEPAGPVTLDILDPAGRVVRSFSSEATGETAQPVEGGMRRPTLERVGTARLPKSAGMHRFVWDLRHPGPWDAEPARSGRGGPMVVPGAYRVRLTVGDQVLTQPLTVRTDPRVVRDGVTAGVIAAQVAHNLRVRDAITDARLAAARVASARKRLATGDGAGNSEAIRRLAALEARLVTAEGRYTQPMLIGQLTYLNGLTTQADQPVPADAVSRLAELRRQLAQIITETDQALGGPAPATPSAGEASAGR